MKKAYWFLVLLLVLTAASAYAGGEGSEYTSAQAAVNSNLSGSIPQATADLFSGAFNTSIPIATPDGRRSIQPDLKLTYNSRMGNGWIGVGWNMPMASIARSMRKGVPAYNDSDTFEFSGQELVLISGNTYRLKKESSFMKFEKDTSNNRWIATDLNGTKYYFGNGGYTRSGRNIGNFDETFQWYLAEVVDVFSNYMKIYYQEPSSTIGYHYPYKIEYTGNVDQDTAPFYEIEFFLEERDDSIPVYTAGFNMNIAHRLQSIEVRAGGDLVRKYAFSYRSSPESGRSLLEQVQIIGADDETTLPPTEFQYHNPGGSEKQWHEDSTWQVSLDKASFGKFHEETRKDYGVRFADVNSDGRPDIVKARKVVVCENYVCEDTYQHHVYLNNGEGWNWDENDSENQKYTQCLIEVHYKLLEPEYDEVGLAFTTFKEGRDSSDDYGLRIFDINGDGRPDLVYAKKHDDGTLSAVFLHQGNDSDTVWKHALNWNIPPDFGFIKEEGDDRGVRFGDLNGDGLIDLVKKRNWDDEPPIIYINKGDGSWKDANPGLVNTWPTKYYNFADRKIPFIKLIDWTPWETGLRLIDLNGDGLSDLIFSGDVLGPTGHQCEYGAWLNTSRGWEYRPEYTPPVKFTETGDTPAEFGVRLFDINNDGLVDIFANSEEKAAIYIQKSINNDDGKRWHESQSYNIDDIPEFVDILSSDEGDNCDRGVRFADVDGDRAIDIVKANSEEGVGTWINDSQGVTDLLIKIDNSQGMFTNISYTPSSEFREHSYCQEEDPHNEWELPQTVAVVNQVTTRVYDGGIVYGGGGYINKLGSRQRYVYCGGYLYQGDKDGDSRTEFRGFGRVRAETYSFDPDTNNYELYTYSDTYFDQDRGNYDGYRTGLIEYASSFDASGRMLQSTENEYEEVSIMESNPDVVHVYQTRQDNYAIDHPDDQTEIEVHTAVENANVYDTTNGLIEEIYNIQLGLAEDDSDMEKYTFTKFLYNTSMWLQKIERTWMTTTEPANPIPGITETDAWSDVYQNRVSEKVFSYDDLEAGQIGDKGLLTRTQELLSDTYPETDPDDPDDENSDWTEYLTTWSTSASNYDSFGNLRSWSDFGVNKTIEYDTETQTLPWITTTDPGGLNHMVETSYDYRWGKVLTKRGPFTEDQTDSIKTRNVYDDFGRMIQTYVIPYGETGWILTGRYNYRVELYPTYPPNVTEVHTRYEEGNNDTIDSYKFYDPAGRIIQTKSEDTTQGNSRYQIVQDTEYDSFGRTTRKSLPYRISPSNPGNYFPGYLMTDRLFKEYEYDEKNRVTKIYFPDETEITTVYQGLLKDVYDIVNNRTTAQQDAYGNLVSITNMDEQGTKTVSTSYKYNALGDLVETDGPAPGESDKIEIEYDSLSRKYWMQDPDMGKWMYTYDGRGNLDCQIDIGGPQGGSTHDFVCYDYDAINRVTRKYDFTNNLNLPQCKHSECFIDHELIPPVPGDIDSYYSTVHYSYDTYPRDAVAKSPGEDYNTLGSLTAVYNLDGGKFPLLQYIYEFDAYGRTKTEHFRIKSLRWETSYDYNLAGQIRTVTYPDGSRVSYDYDNAGLPVRVYEGATVEGELPLDQQVFASFGEVDTDGSVISSGYNALGQVLQINYGNGVSDSFAYYDENEDQQKNYRLKSIITNGPLGEEYFKNEFGYLDASGRISPNITEIKDPRFGDQVMTYDFLNRLTSSSQSSPTDTDNPFKLGTGEGWSGYGDKYFTYADNGNILARTRPVSTGASAEEMSYTYDDEKIHAVTGVQAGATILFSAEYDDNGSMTHKLSEIDADLREHYYVYDSDGRMTAALDSDSARISDSFYHLQGGRVFEGRIGDVNGSGFVQGSLSVNPYFELKISSGDAVYMVKHVVAGGRRVASVYEQVSDYSARGMGCASIGSRVAVAGHRECLAAAFVILFVPLFIALLVGTRFFTRGGFREHPLRSALALIVLVVFLVEFSPLVSVDLDLANPLHKKELYKNLNLLLNAAYQNGKIPKSKAALEFFENLKHARSSGGLRLTFGPRAARADEIEKDVLYFHADQLGSTRVVTRGSDGSVYSYNNYLPFGKMLEGQTMGGEILPDYALFKNSYTGQEADRTTGLYFYQSRFYDADLGRFTQADTVVPRPLDTQTFNRYTYVNNNPFKFTDPTGHSVTLALIIETAIKIVFTYLVATAIVNQVTGANIRPTAQGVMQTLLMAALCSIPGGVGTAFSVLFLMKSVIDAANGDKVAMVNVVISLVIISYKVGKTVVGNMKMLGYGSPTNGPNTEPLTQEETKYPEDPDFVRKILEENKNAPAEDKATLPPEVRARKIDWSGTGAPWEYNFHHTGTFMDFMQQAALIIKAMPTRRFLSWRFWAKKSPKFPELYKLVKKYREDSYFFTKTGLNPDDYRGVITDRGGWYKATEAEWIKLLSANEAIGNYYNFKGAMIEAEKNPSLGPKSLEDWFMR